MGRLVMSGSPFLALLLPVWVGVAFPSAGPGAPEASVQWTDPDLRAPDPAVRLPDAAVRLPDTSVRSTDPGVRRTDRGVRPAGQVSPDDVLAPPFRPDTALAARPGDRLVVENFSGRVLVVGHGSERVELRAVPDRDTGLGLARRGDRIVVIPAERRPVDRDVRVGIRVPRWMPIVVQGRDLDVEVEDVEGRVEVRNVEGEVVLREVRGGARVSSVNGSIRVRDARGDLLLRSRGDDVTVDGSSGEVLDAESGDGDVLLRDVDALRVRAETLDGDVLFDGTPRPDGRYRVAVHDGDARVRIPRDAGLLVRVSTFDGEFLSDFPVTVERLRSGGTFEFPLGDGSGELEIEVFDGEIRLEERGAPRGFD